MFVSGRHVAPTRAAQPPISAAGRRVLTRITNCGINATIRCELTPLLAAYYNDPRGHYNMCGQQLAGFLPTLAVKPPSAFHRQVWGGNNGLGQ